MTSESTSRSTSSERIVLGADAYRPCPLTSEEEIQQLDLWNRLEANLNAGWTPGIGLAAPQIGVYVQASIVRIPASKTIEACSINVWNPVIESPEEPIVFAGEGCLSYPKEYWHTRRYASIVLRNGDGRRYSLHGLEAVVVQHEIGHLIGRSFSEFRAYQSNSVGRNDPCPCLSGRKYKKCCGK